ncbi:AtpD F0F1-type ATP synthase beta subunit [Pyrenophora tritici-repentis]|uniref:Uncharacterized protein n=1 Tax=Pyrenophora tritici-repentis TaxID=45151 RepID=A0A2W1DYY9_9PLEO|nr:ATP synthase subunit beta [Pyrenophora tritici-repentis]KAF7572109.1 hypothetical protein PtrM4_096090 [Pyrenophora tritici-repentis]KAI1535239.1 AtpD F0F1-type ATP synthase beta subunit [Pyrenophora tritici-repentis]KAI1538761.1 AtpD F0F1-type ATP synthase beta subunit [Pyrenophora tritici-repentis]KAI1549349.1 AtpD F0F1-type ATP synthase beta subunit [Pyrenophora tritici-repentis]
MLKSGIQQALRASMRRPAIRRSAFQPLKKSFAPALSTRFASTDAANHGKIHQVIGAIVDVKFDTEQLPAILNAVTTQNGDQKLILEVAVRMPRSGYVEQRH